MKKITGKSFLKGIKAYTLITLGTLITALGINLFHAPAQIVSGGAVGIAIIVNALTKVPLGVIILALNVPLFLIGWRFLGDSFSVRTLYSVLLYPLLTELTAFVSPLTDDLMLATLAGSVLLGAGMGMVFLAGASTGGTDVLALLAHKYLPLLGMGQWIFLIELIIVGINVFISGSFDLGFYGILALFINTSLIDFMIQGANTAKMVYIISPKYGEIAESVLKEIERGVTGLHARGMYTKEDTMMLLCVIKRHEIQKLEKIVQGVDPSAFLIFSQVHQVSGEGFKIYPEL
ncbi:MAG: YitT family protein [Clostridia bacterium]|nr:YitT family protein [Clostridia bacterium]